MRLSFLIMLFSIISFSGCHSQTSLKMGTHQKVILDSLGMGYGYLEYLPYKYSNDKKYPLLLFLHGAGERGDGSISGLDTLYSHGPFRRLLEGNWKKEAVIISPQSSSGWFSAKHVKSIYDYLLQNYSIDTCRIYVVGMSAGGGASWKFVHTFENIPTAIIDVCGAYDLPEKSTSIQHIPIWCFHNSGDPVVDFDRSVKNVNKIAGTDQRIEAVFPPLDSGKVGPVTVFTAQFLGGQRRQWSISDGVVVPQSNLALTVYDTFGHDSWTETFANEKVWDWLFRQSRCGK